MSYRETSLLAKNYLIAESCRQQLNTMVSNAQFFSLLMDRSTDASNHDNELMLVAMV